MPNSTKPVEDNVMPIIRELMGVLDKHEGHLGATAVATVTRLVLESIAASMPPEHIRAIEAGAQSFYTQIVMGNLKLETPKG